MQGVMVGMDTETTGVNPATARVLTACVIPMNPGTGYIQRQEWLLNPGVQIPQESIEIHGISDEMVVEYGLPTEIGIPQIITRLNELCGSGETPLVAYNAAYDVSVLEREAIRCGCRGLSSKIRVIDPHVIDKNMDKYRKGSRKLTTTARQYGIRFRNAHDATADATAAVRLAWRLGMKFPELAQMTLEELHEAQVQWRAEQCASLERHLREVNEDDTIIIDPEWPLIPLSVEEHEARELTLGVVPIPPQLGRGMKRGGLGPNRGAVRCRYGSCGNATLSPSGMCWRHMPPR